VRDELRRVGVGVEHTLHRRNLLGAQQGVLEIAEICARLPALVVHNGQGAMRSEVDGPPACANPRGSLEMDLDEDATK